ncbi:hypothetical protein ACFWPK_34355 [Nocardia sp. NPDC058519]|uniref:hypothetical protein n=1 Tax=Nocardia sp. NPDC058519 TaxID=3346535 RepID=UPI0036630F21
MNTVAHLIQCAIVGATLLAVIWVFVMLVRADLRANPAKAKLPKPWAPMEEFHAYFAALDYSADDDEEQADDEPVDQADPGAEWDRARDRTIDADLWPVTA